MVFYRIHFFTKIDDRLEIKMLTVNNLTKSFGSRVLLDNISVRILPGEKIAFIGANGTGKTTFLKIVAGSEIYDSGEIVFDDRSAVISFLSQIVTVKPYNKVYDEIKMGVAGFAQLELKLREAEEALSLFSEDSSKLDAAINNYAQTRDEFEKLGGDDIEWQIDRIMLGLGFSLKDKDRFVSEFSGGWKMRIEFAKLLLRKSDLLILDEPTNHLDVKAISWLEDYLCEYSGAVILVSHDRYFINRVASRILSLSNQKIKSYTGNYDAFVKQRNEEIEQLEKRYKLEQKQLEHDRRFIERFRYKATLATRVKSREKMIAKRDLIDLPLTKERCIHLGFEFDEKQMTTVFSLKDLEKHFNSKTVSFEGEAQIVAGDRVALIGENGSGKTTFLNILSGKDKDYSGKLKTHNSALIRYYMQNQELFLHDDKTVLDELSDWAPDKTVTALRSMLGAFLFRGDDVYKKVEVLSGGEKARLALAITISAPSNIIFLDEPTNHLDIASREALALALDAYEGTIILVSHDRYFIDQICGRIFEIDGSTLSVYNGDYTFYYEQKQKQILKEIKPLSSQKKVLKKNAKSFKQGEKSAETSLGRSDEIEALIISKEKEIAQLETMLSDPKVIEQSNKLKELSLVYSGLRDEIELLWNNYGAFESI